MLKLVPRLPTPLTPTLTIRKPRSLLRTYVILSTGWWAGARKACRERDGRVAVTIPGGVSTNGNSPRFRSIALWASRRVSCLDLRPFNKKHKACDWRCTVTLRKPEIYVTSCVPFAVVLSVACDDRRCCIWCALLPLYGFGKVLLMTLRLSFDTLMLKTTISARTVPKLTTPLLLAAKNN